GIPKWAWIVLVVLIPWVGPITWLVVGKDRSQGDGGQPGRAPRRQGPLAPDEDPEFLRKLDEDLRRERRSREREMRERQAGPESTVRLPDDDGTETGYTTDRETDGDTWYGTALRQTIHAT